MRKCVALLWLLLIPVGAQANTVASVLPDAELRGTATYRFLGFPLFKAQLFTPSGAPLDWSKDFGLELQYLRALSQFELVEGTMRSFATSQEPRPTRAQLNACFSDVRKGDRYTAISSGQNKISFLLNGRRMCTLDHPQIKTRFMGIFLSDNARSQSFARTLKAE